MQEMVWSIWAFQLFSVPFAHYAMVADTKDDADADPTNEIQDISRIIGYQIIH